MQSVHTAVTSFTEAGLVDDGTAHAGSASTLRVTERGEALLTEAARALARLDDAFALQHPDLTVALRALMSDMAARTP